MSDHIPVAVVEEGVPIGSRNIWTSDGMQGIVVGLLLLAAIPLVEYLSALFAHEWWRLFNEGNIVDAAYRISLSELPHRDFPYYYTGGWEMLLGGLFLLFGNDLLVARIALGVVMAVTGYLMYCILRHVRVGRLASALASLLVPLYAFVFLFIVFPAWPAQAFVLGALLVFLLGMERNVPSWLVLAGGLLGLATLCKQSIGPFGLMAGMHAVILLQRSGTAGTAQPGSAKAPTRSVTLRHGGIMALPAFAFLILAVMTHREMSLHMDVMILLAPLLLAVASIANVVKQGRHGAGPRRMYVESVQRHLLALGGGFALGVLPLVALFALQGNLMTLIRETFLAVSGIVAHRMFFPPELVPPGAPLVQVLRHVVPFYLPLVISVTSLAVGLWRSRHDTPDQPTVFLVSAGCFIGLMNMTMYPEVMDTYLFYEGPLLVLPVIFLGDLLFKKSVHGSRLRTWILAALVGMALLYQVGKGVMRGWPSWMDKHRVAMLREDQGKVHVRAPYAEYLAPVLEYLSHRPAGEHMISFDKFGKVIGFLALRRNDVDYGLRWVRGGPMDLTEAHALLDAAAGHRTAIILIEKEWLKNKEVSAALFVALSREYHLELDVPGHMIFQRNTRL